MLIYLAAKEREKAEKLALQKKAAEAGVRLPSTPSTPKKASGSGGKKSEIATPVRPADARQLDLSALNLNTPDLAAGPPVDEPMPKITLAREKVLEEARNALQAKDQKKSVSLVVIGKVQHVSLE